MLAMFGCSDLNLYQEFQESPECAVTVIDPLQLQWYFYFGNMSAIMLQLLGRSRGLQGTCGSDSMGHIGRAHCSNSTKVNECGISAMGTGK